MQSGTTGVGIYDANTTASSWYNVSSTLGCGDANSNADDVLICMRTKNITEIVRAIPVDSSSSTGSAAFWPTIDEVTVFSDYHARSLAGRFIKVPLLIGNTDYEGGFYATLAAIAGNVLPRAFWETFSDEIFTCPAANRANVSVSAGLPTWRYRYFGSFENLRLTTEPNSGAYHASEVPVLFGDLPPDSTEDEIAVGNYMRGAWASFAKDPNMGLKNYWWPRYRPGTNSLVRLAFDNQTGANAALAGKYDGSCDATFPVGKKG
jgi:cholinesterase